MHATSIFNESKCTGTYLYNKKKLRVSGTRGMRQGGRLKMCSPHRLIMKERNFSEF